MKIGKMQFTPMQLGIIVLTLATAVIHFTLRDPLMILNGVGYLAFLAVTFFVTIPALVPFRKQIRWAFIGYTAVTFVLFFVFNASTGYGPLGLITKGIEAALIALLFMDK